MSEDISSFDWISPKYHAIDKLTDTYNIIKYIENNSLNRPGLKLQSSILYIPDSAEYYINKCESPLNHLFGQKHESFIRPADNLYDLSTECNDIGITISIIIISAGVADAFAFIDPSFVPAVYKFITIYLPDYEKHFSTTINRIITAVLDGTQTYLLSYDAAKVLFELSTHISQEKYPKFITAIGYAIWKLPTLPTKTIDFEKFHISDLTGVCHKNINWSDVYTTILAIKYAPADELDKIEKLR
jgi:hypothetical protein